MATITLTVDDTKVAGIIAAIDRRYGVAVAGMTNRQKFVHHVKQGLLTSAMQIERGKINLTAEVNAVTAANAAVAAESAARKTAEANADAAARTLLDGVS